MRASLLLLADSRLPAGAHAHSGGVEAAVNAGLVTDLTDLERFLHGRLSTVGVQAAGVAACACEMARADAPARDWTRLDREVGARTPSAAQREAARAQGHALLRLVRAVWPTPVLDRLGTRPYHPVVLGVGVAALGGTAREAASVAALGAVTGPASAALRLLGLDPVAVTALTARLASRVDDLVDQLVGDITRSPGYAPERLPAVGAPMLDVLAERHAAEEVRLFAS